MRAFFGSFPRGFQARGGDFRRAPFFTQISAFFSRKMKELARDGRSLVSETRGEAQHIVDNPARPGRTAVDNLHFRANAARRKTLAPDGFFCYDKNNT